MQITKRIFLTWNRTWLVHGNILGLRAVAGHKGVSITIGIWLGYWFICLPRHDKLKG